MNTNNLPANRVLLESWKSLVEHAKEMKTKHMNDLFNADKDRFDKFSVQLPNAT